MRTFIDVNNLIIPETRGYVEVSDLEDFWKIVRNLEKSQEVLIYRLNQNRYIIMEDFVIGYTNEARVN